MWPGCSGAPVWLTIVLPVYPCSLGNSQPAGVSIRSTHSARQSGAGISGA
jgi:hypothetical protein